jgi:hypothetical protein
MVEVGEERRSGKGMNNQREGHERVRTLTVVKYTTEEEYQSYISHSLPDTPLWLMDSDA